MEHRAGAHSKYAENGGKILWSEFKGFKVRGGGERERDRSLGGNPGPSIGARSPRTICW